MRALGTGETSSLVIKNFDKALHIRMRTASVKYSTSVKALTIEGMKAWLRLLSKKDKEAKDAQKAKRVLNIREAQKKVTNKTVGSNPASPKIDGAVAER